MSSQFPSDSPFYQEKKPFDHEQLQLFPTHHLEIEASEKVDPAKAALDLINQAIDTLEWSESGDHHIDEALVFLQEAVSYLE